MAERWGGRKVTAERARWLRKLPVPCAICTRPVYPTDRWHLHHFTDPHRDNPNGPVWPAHSACNQELGARVVTLEPTVDVRFTS